MKALLVLIILAFAGVAVAMAVRASKEESREARSLRSLPPSVQHVVSQMDGTTQAAFFNEYWDKRRKASVGYILWWVLGFHYLYARKVGVQLLYWVTFGGFGLWAIADLFRMPSIMRDANEQQARQALQTLHIAAAYHAPTAPAPTPEVRPSW